MQIIPSPAYFESKGTSAEDWMNESDPFELSPLIYVLLENYSDVASILLLEENRKTNYGIFFFILILH